MFGAVMCVVIGAVLCFIGTMNIRGDISSLHSYHRSRVKEEDVKPFGKLVGIGTVVAGISIIIMGVLTGIAIALEKELFTVIGTVFLFVGLPIGICIMFYAMKKYNGGIF